MKIIITLLWTVAVCLQLTVTGAGSAKVVAVNTVSTHGTARGFFLLHESELRVEEVPRCGTLPCLDAFSPGAYYPPHHGSWRITWRTSIHFAACGMIPAESGRRTS